MNELKFYPNNSLPGSQGSIKYITLKDFEQIIKNQNDAVIVDRLKKLVKELGEYQGLLEHPMYLELQKILGDSM